MLSVGSLSPPAWPQISNPLGAILHNVQEEHLPGAEPGEERRAGGRGSSASWKTSIASTCDIPRACWYRHAGSRAKIVTHMLASAAAATGG